jgi:hypothetical protein
MRKATYERADRIYIAVNGQTREVRNRLSSGPDCEPHTFILYQGEQVSRYGNVWKLEKAGRRPQVVTVADIQGNKK